MNRSIWNRNVVLALLIALFAGFSHQVFNIVFPVYVLDIHGSDSFTGTSLTALTIAALAARFLFGHFPDRFGRKIMMIAGSGLFCLNIFAYCFVHSFAGIFFLRICNGISQGIFFPVPHIVIADSVKEEDLASALGLMGVFGSIPVALAPTIGLYIFQNFGARALFTTAGFTAFAAAAFAAALKNSYIPKTTHEKFTFHISSFLDISAVLPSLGVVMVYFAYAGVINFLTPYGLSIYLDNIGTYFIFNTIAVVITRLAAQPILKKLQMKKAMTSGILTCTAGLLLIASIKSMSAILIASILLGYGVTIVSQLSEVYVLNQASQENRGKATSTWMIATDLGNGFGAMAAGNTADTLGYTSMFSLSAVIGLLALLTNRFYKKENI